MNLPSPPQTPPTPLERRERRPTGTILVLAALFALPMGTCGGIGTYKATRAAQEPVATTPAEVAALGDGTYVTLDAPLVHVATDELPLDERLVAKAPGTTVYAVTGEGALFVSSERRDLAATPRASLRGQVCSGDTTLACTTSTGLGLFLREEEKRLGRPVKVVLEGASSRGEIVEAAIGLGIAGALGLLLIGVVAIILRGRRRPFVFVEHTAPARGPLDAARLATALGPAYRLARASPDRVVFLTGVTAARAQSVGAPGADDLPQRVELAAAGGDAYRVEPLVHVRVSEILAQLAGPMPQALPAVRAALERTLARALAALGA